MSASWIRLAMRDDAEVINGIQNHYVVHSTATFLTEPLTLEQRLAWFDRRSPAHPVMFAQADGSVVGWGSFEVFRGRPAYRHTAEFSIYVHHEWHRRGIGRAILGDLLARALWGTIRSSADAAASRRLSLRCSRRRGFPASPTSGRSAASSTDGST